MTSDWFAEPLTGWWEQLQPALTVLAGLSLVLLLVSLLALPWILARLPVDILVRPSPQGWSVSRVVRNLVGITLILLGIAMLVLPGQGLVAIFVGLILADVPKKRDFLIGLMRRPQVAAVVNGLRARSNQPPLQTQVNDPS